MKKRVVILVVARLNFWHWVISPQSDTCDKDTAGAETDSHADAMSMLPATAYQYHMRLSSLLLVMSLRGCQGFVFNPWLQKCRHLHSSAIKLTSSDNGGNKENSTDTHTRYYLLKSEPSDFSIYDLEKAGNEEWDGVRNYQARNIMRTMKKNDRAFFYHSSCKQVGIVGTAIITREAQPDVTAYQDPQHKGYDAKSTAENCRWDAVQVRLDKIFPVTLTLKELKVQAQHNDALADMMLFRNTRLSVHQLTADEWAAVEDLVERKVAGEDLLLPR